MDITSIEMNVEFCKDYDLVIQANQLPHMAIEFLKCG